MPRLTIAVLSVAVLLAVARPADAFLIQDLAGPQSATNGVALGPDGNFWVAEQYADSLVRMSPGGAVVQRYPVGLEPHAVVNGPGDRVWVGVSGAKQLVWFDAKAATPTAHPITLPADCPPEGLAAANGRMYFSCGDGAKVGYVKDDGTGAVTTVAVGGTVYDLATFGGKLYAPDYNGDAVRRLSADLAVESTITFSAGSGPDGIASDGAGTLWVTENGSGRLGHFPAAQTGGTATEVTPTGGTLADPFGIVVGADGRIYVAAKGSHNIVRVDADGTNARFYGVSDGAAEPFHIIRGPDDDLWFTDQNKTRISRLVNGVPRASTGAATATGPSSAAVTAAVDPRGNATTVVFDYGPTASYGQTSSPVTVPNGVGAVAVPGALAGLAAGTTYHVRARATSGEGQALGADATFTTAPAPALTPVPLGPAPPTPIRPPVPRVTAKTSFQVHTSAKTHKTVVSKVVISGLKGTEKATLTCAGKHCPFTTKRYTLKKSTLKKGARSFGRAVFKDRNLAGTTTITIQVTATGAIGTSTMLQIRAGKKPKIVRGCLQPGAKKASVCPR